MVDWIGGEESEQEVGRWRVGYGAYETVSMQVAEILIYIY